MRAKLALFATRVQQWDHRLVRGSLDLALAAMTGGALLVVGNALLLADPDARGLDSGADYAIVAVVVAGALLVAAGLVAVHRAQRTSYGRQGLIAFVLTLVAQLATAAYLATANELPILIGLLASVMGFPLLTIAIVRAPAVPRWSGYLAFIAVVGMLVVGDADLGIATAGVAWLAIGYVLRAGREPEQLPSGVLLAEASGVQ
jgi:hypothetical protein